MPISKKQHWSPKHSADVSLLKAFPLRFLNGAGALGSGLWALGPRPAARCEQKVTSTLGPELLPHPPPPQSPAAHTAVWPGQRPARQGHGAAAGGARHGPCPGRAHHRCVRRPLSHHPSPAAPGHQSRFPSNRLEVAAESQEEEEEPPGGLVNLAQEARMRLPLPGAGASCRPSAPAPLLPPAPRPLLTFVPVVQLLQLLLVHRASHGCLEARTWVWQEVVCGHVYFPLILRYVAGHGEEMP